MPIIYPNYLLMAISFELTLVLRDPYRSGFTMHVCVAGDGSIRDLVLLEVNAEIAILTICRISSHFFHENFTDFDRVFGVSDENGTYYDRESYVLDPKLTLTCNALRGKVPILYRIGKKYSASSASWGKKYLAL